MSFSDLTRLTACKRKYSQILLHLSVEVSCYPQADAFQIVITHGPESPSLLCECTKSFLLLWPM